MGKKNKANDVLIIDDKFWKEFGNCGHCGTSSAKFTCGRCKGVKYCSKECQTSSWKPKHKHQCDMMRRKIHEAAADKENYSKLCEITDEIFSNDSKYPILETDPNMNITVTDLVSFGDLEDAVRESSEPIPVGGTIMGLIHTVRHFHPGIYRCTHAIPYKDHAPLFIYHHENIDPVKIIRQSYLMIGDFNRYNRYNINAINRYDWCHSSSWGVRLTDESEENDDKVLNMRPKDEKRLKDRELLKKRRSDIYFASYENASVLKDCVKKEYIEVSKFGPKHYSIKSPQNHSSIAMAVEIEDTDWKYGKAFQDKSSEKYFALMVLSDMKFMENVDYLRYDYSNIKDFYYKLSKRYPDKRFTTTRKTEFMFNMSDFEV